MLGQLGSKTVSTARVKSRSVFKAKLAVLEMQASSNKADIDEIISDTPKGEINKTPTKN